MAVSLVTVGVLAVGLPAVAGAATWCGTTTTSDRPPLAGGPSIHVVYAYPADAPDRSAERAPQISADVDEITSWWRGQDRLREPRFDLAAFPCGAQVDLRVLRLADSAATLYANAGRTDRVTQAVAPPGGFSAFTFDKHLVYYDGEVDNTVCGEGGGHEDGYGIAIVYLQASCGAATSARIAAHEIVHALGALPITSGPPHPCLDSPSHVCDNALDVLGIQSYADLGGLVLDAGRDDYYGHGGAWLDVQDSGWLKLSTQQVPVTVIVSGRGSVESDVPGIECSARCVVEWDAGTILEFAAVADDSQRFVGWGGDCRGSDSCSVKVTGPRSVFAIFAPPRLPLSLSVVGNGSIHGAGSACRGARCTRSVPSYAPLRLRAGAVVGWRFAGWSGACTGRGAVCTVAMQKATTVRARYVRR
jgi:hypothetical protein